jgi:hypothetical protein
MLESKNSFHKKMFPGATPYEFTPQRTDTTYVSSFARRFEIDAFHAHPTISSHTPVISRLLSSAPTRSPLVSSPTNSTLPLSPGIITNILECYCTDESLQKRLHFKKSFSRRTLQRAIQFILYHITTVNLKSPRVRYARTFKYLPLHDLSDTQVIQISDDPFLDSRLPCTIGQKSKKLFSHCDIGTNDKFSQSRTKSLENQRESLCLMKPKHDKAFIYQPVYCSGEFSLEWILLACNMNQQIIQLTNLLKDQQTFHKQWMRKKNCQINRLSSFIKQISHELCLSTEAFRLLYKQLENYNAQEKQRDELYNKNQPLFTISSPVAHLNPFPLPKKSLTFLKQTSNDRLNPDTNEKRCRQLMSSKLQSAFEKFQKSKSNSFTIEVGVKISDPCLPAPCVSNTGHEQFFDNSIFNSTQATYNIKEISLASFSLGDNQERSYGKKLREPYTRTENIQPQNYSKSLYGTGQDAQCLNSHVKQYTCVDDAQDGVDPLESYTKNEEKLHQMHPTELYTSVDTAPRHINIEGVCSNGHVTLYPFGMPKAQENTQALSYPNNTIQSNYTLNQQPSRVCTVSSKSSVSSVPCRKTDETADTISKQTFYHISSNNAYATRKQEFHPHKNSLHDDMGEDALHQHSIEGLDLINKDVLDVRGTLKSHASSPEENPSSRSAEPYPAVKKKWHQMSSEKPYATREKKVYQNNEGMHDATSEDLLYQGSIGKLTSTAKDVLLEGSTLRSYAISSKEMPASYTDAMYANGRKELHHANTEKPYPTAGAKSYRTSNYTPSATCKEQFSIKSTVQPYVTEENDLDKSCSDKPYESNENIPHDIAMMETECNIYGVCHRNPEIKRTESMWYPDSVLKEELQLSQPEIVCNTSEKKQTSALVGHRYSMIREKSLNMEKRFITTKINHMRPIAEAYSNEGTMNYSLFNNKESTMYEKEAEKQAENCFKKGKEFASGRGDEFISLEAYKEMVCSLSPFKNVVELEQVPCSLYNKNCMNTNNSHEISKKLNPIQNLLGDPHCRNASTFVSSKHNDLLNKDMLDILSLGTTIEIPFNSKFKCENDAEQPCRATSAKYYQYRSVAYQNNMLLEEKCKKTVASTQLDNALIERETFLSTDKLTTLSNLPVDLREPVKEWNIFWSHQQSQVKTFFKQRHSVTKIKLVSQHLPLPYKNYYKNRVVIIATDVSPFQLKKSIGKHGDWDLLERILVSLPPVDPRFVLDIKAWIWVATRKILFSTTEQEKNTTELTVILDKTIRNMLTESQCLSTLNMKKLGYSTFQEFNEELRNFSVSSQCRFSKFVDLFLYINQQKDTPEFNKEHFLKPRYVTKQLFTQSIQYLGHSMNNQCSTTIVLCCGIGHFFQQKNTTLPTTRMFQPFAEKNLQTNLLKNSVYKPSYKKTYTSTELFKSSYHDWIHTAFLIPSDFLSLKHGSPNVLRIKLIRLEKFLHLSETMRHNTELTILIDTGGVGTEFHSFAEKNLQSVMLPHKEEEEACHRISKLIHDSLLISRTAPNGGTVHVRLCRYKHLTYKPSFHTSQSLPCHHEWGYREFDLSKFINNLKILCPSLAIEIDWD